MIAVKNAGGRTTAILDRAGAQKRLRVLMLQAQDLNPVDDHEQALAIRAAINQAMQTIRQCDAALQPTSPDLDELPSAAAGIEARHARMRTLLAMLDGLPPSCTQTARALRRALQRELRGPSIGRTR